MYENNYNLFLQKLQLYFIYFIRNDVKVDSILEPPVVISQNYLQHTTSSAIAFSIFIYPAQAIASTFFSDTGFFSSGPTIIIFTLCSVISCTSHKCRNNCSVSTRSLNNIGSCFCRNALRIRPYFSSLFTSMDCNCRNQIVSCPCKRRHIVLKNVIFFLFTHV